MRFGLLATVLLLAAAPADAQAPNLPAPALSEHVTRDPQDAVLREIAVEEKLGAALPLDLAFFDQAGREVKLRDYFTGKPVVLTLNFYECPMLCPMELHNLAGTVSKVQGLALGRDYRLVTVSFNAEETLPAAQKIAASIYGMMEGAEAPEKNWPFLIGREADIQKLTQAVGYHYKQIAENNFAHPAAIVVLTPEAEVSRYLYGLVIEPFNLRLALLEAAEGKIGGTPILNQAIMFCFHYDPAGRKYALYAWNLMKVTGVLTLAGVGLIFLVARMRKPAGEKA